MISQGSLLSTHNQITTQKRSCFKSFFKLQEINTFRHVENRPIIQVMISQGSLLSTHNQITTQKRSCFKSFFKLQEINTFRHVENRPILHIIEVFKLRTQNLLTFSKVNLPVIFPLITPFSSP